MASINLKYPELVLSQFADTGTYAKVTIASSKAINYTSDWLIILASLIRDSETGGTHLSVMFYTSEGHNQGSHLGANGNTDARHSQREGERD